MTATLIQFALSAVVIIVAGTALTRFGDVIADRTQLSGLFVGGILIAGATSLPELATDIHAVRLGSADLAVGDLMGSSLFNLAILAALDLTRFSRGRLLRSADGNQVSVALLSLALTTLAAVFLLVAGQAGSPTLAGLGPGPWALVIAYVAGQRLVFRHLPDDAPEQEATSPSSESQRSWIDRLGLKQAIVGYLLCAAVILVAAPFLARSADQLAEMSGLGGTFFGTTLVALCTSLPEMVTTFVAVRLGAHAMALGNIFGSNCFNMAILAPLDLFHPGSLFESVAPSHVYTALCAILLTTLALLSLIRRTERRSWAEPNAWHMLAAFAAALAGLYLIRE